MYTEYGVDNACQCKSGSTSSFSASHDHPGLYFSSLFGFPYGLETCGVMIRTIWTVLSSCQLLSYNVSINRVGEGSSSFCPVPKVCQGIVNSWVDCMEERRLSVVSVLICVPCQRGLFSCGCKSREYHEHSESV